MPSPHVRPTFALLAAATAFVVLAGTAGAVVTAAVPLATRALTADKAKTADRAKIAATAENAKRLGGRTADQLVASAIAQASESPGPASTAQGLVTVKTGTTGQVPDDNYVHPFRVACDAGTRIVSAGFSSDRVVLSFQSYPVDATTWTMDLAYADADGSTATVSLYALCIK